MQTKNIERAVLDQTSEYATTKDYMAFSTCGGIQCDIPFIGRDHSLQGMLVHEWVVRGLEEEYRKRRKWGLMERIAC